MDSELIEWLNMVYGALEEADSEKRADMLIHANSFLELSRNLVPATAEMHGD